MKKIAIIGSGNMGAGIAAHIANAGYEVLLYDIILQGQIDRNFLANNAIKKLKNDKIFAAKISENLVTPLNLQDDLSRLKEADWIIEVVTENLQIKYNLYNEIEKYKNPDSLISSNTSTINLEILTKNMSLNFKKKFFITHFFNPPRYMKLLELVSHEMNEQQDLNLLYNFCSEKLGKNVIKCYDSPGFIANRIGCYFLEISMREAVKNNILPSILDQYVSQYLSMPKTAIFGLYDLIGLDVMKLISESLSKSLQKNDEYVIETQNYPEFYLKNLENNYIGRKGKGGFYRIENKKKQEFNFAINEFSDVKNISLIDVDLAKIFKQEDNISKVLTNIIIKFLYYVFKIAEDIIDDIKLIDEAMKLGYNWKIGPFQLASILGADFLRKEFLFRGFIIPELLEKFEEKYYEKTNIKNISPEIISLSVIKEKSKPIYSSGSSRLWDLGDNILCFEINSKMNNINLDILESIIKIVDYINETGKNLVIYSEKKHFSVGADLEYFLKIIKNKEDKLLREFILTGQKAFNNMAESEAKIVSAVTGYSLGGGCELMLHSNQIIAHIESYIGLTETKLGLIPGWGGAERLIANNVDREISIKNIFEGKISNSAREALEMGFLRDSDKIIMKEEFLLYEAKKACLEPKISPNKLENSSNKLSYDKIKNDLNIEQGNQEIFEYLFKIFSENKKNIINNLEEDAFLKLAKKDNIIEKIEEIIKKQK